MSSGYEMLHDCYGTATPARQQFMVTTQTIKAELEMDFKEKRIEICTEGETGHARDTPQHIRYQTAY